MDDELGALAACERSEHAASVTSLAVHCIVSLGAPFCLFTVGYGMILRRDRWSLSMFETISIGKPAENLGYGYNREKGNDRKGQVASKAQEFRFSFWVESVAFAGDNRFPTIEMETKQEI